MIRYVTAALDRMSPDRRRQLIRVAAQEFAAAGFQGASLNVIIRRCGMSKSSFYYVISSKEELFDRVISDLSAELADRIHIPKPEELAGDAFWPGIESLFARLLELAEADPAMIALGRMTYGSGSSATTSPAATLAKIESWIGAVLVVGRDSGTIRADLPPDLQRQLVFAVLRAMDEWTLTSPDLPTDQFDGLATAQYDAIRRLLAP